MIGTYLNAPYKDREKVKALGARWDPEQRQWYVPHGRDLAGFEPWLPVASALPAASVAVRPAPLVASEPPAPWALGSEDGGLAGAGSALPAAASLSLSQLLGGVTQAVAQAYRAGVWTRLEVVRADVRRGHVYLEAAERDMAGSTVAQARVTVWADTAQRIVPEFERATGVVLGAGIKLLVRARPQFHALYGLSLVVDAIDPAYTLGDLEAKRREIRQRLQREGLFDANRALPPPWDFNAVLVVAPEAAAGLGDFRAEAERLARHGLCEFVYAHSRFQGEGAPDEIRHALLAALDARAASGAPPFDAVVLIRGGGAVNDLAWLDDYALARCLCELPLPVYTGIGHERDRSVLDEVAQQAFDTPSKVIAGIEQRIAQRAVQAREHFAAVVQAARQQLAQARQGAEAALQGLQRHARQGLADSARQADATWAAVQRGTARQLALARQAVPTALAQVQAEARSQLREARQHSTTRLAQVLDHGRTDLARAREALDHTQAELARNARRSVAEARERSQALVREITGQGPEPTLRRGFAVVRDAATGRTLTAAAQARPGQALQVQFHDATVPATVPPSP